MTSLRRIAVVSTAVAAVVAWGGVASPAVHAVPVAPVTLTSEQLAAQGFTLKPNVTAWGPGGAVSLSTNKAAQWQDIIITGTAPTGTPVGQLLTMSRWVPSSTTGDGTLKALNITATVQRDRTFTLHFQLGLPGTYGYAVGYRTAGSAPENRSFQFQFTTTGSGKADPSIGSSTAPKLSAKKLAKAGFTKKPNTTAWEGTATISTHRAPAGAPVTITGTASSPIEPGMAIVLQRFVPTDKKGSGFFQPVANVQTVVAADGTFTLTFELNERGRYGYDLVAQIPDSLEAHVIEFQLKTT